MTIPKPLPEPTPLEPADLPTYEALRLWRRRLAAARGVPPYLVLHNRTLAELARWRPMTLADLRGIRGIGEAKAAHYGPAILAVVRAPDAGLPPDDAIARLSALLLAGAYEVETIEPGILRARPLDGGPALRLILEPEPAAAPATDVQEGQADA